MTKNEMYTKIAEASGVSKANVEEVIKALSDELLEVIAANDSFKLGDVVTIMETRPLSKTKKYVLVEVVKVKETL